MYTDNKPLIYLSYFKDIVSAISLGCFLEEMRCIIRYIPGKENIIISDFISRNGINDDPIQILSVVLDHVKFTTKKILKEQMKDNDILQMLSYLQTGKKGYAENFPPYPPYVHKLTISNGLLTFDHHGVLCIVVPESLRQEIPTLKHTDWSAGHFGIFKTHRKVYRVFGGQVC